MLIFGGIEENQHCNTIIVTQKFFKYMKKKAVLPFLCILFFCCIFINNVSADDNTLLIMSYNIRNAKGLDNITDYQRIAEVVLREAPDVVTVQELDSVTGRSKGVDVLKELADRTNMHHVYGASIVYDGGKYGLGVLSKETPLSYRSIALPGREERRQLLIVEFGHYVLGCTHLSLTKEDRMLSIDIIRSEAAKLNKPFFLTGDFNANPESEFIKELQKDFSLLNNVKNATFPADEPKECIDYIAYYNGGRKTVEERPFIVLSDRVVDEKIASDHRPVVATIRFKSDAILQKKD